MKKLEPSGVIPYIRKALLDRYDSPDPGEAQGQSIILMEPLYKDAKSLLGEYASAMYIPFNRLRMIQQMALGLSYAHNRGIVHRHFHLGNLIKQKPDGDRWMIVDWDTAVEYKPKPGMRSLINIKL